MLLLIALVAGAAVVHGHPTTTTPAAQFWQHALPGTTMPEAIANLVKKGIHIVLTHTDMDMEKENHLMIMDLIYLFGILNF